jgi:hypothetical protein
MLQPNNVGCNLFTLSWRATMTARTVMAGGVLACLMTLTSGACRSDEPGIENAKARMEAARKTFQAILERRNFDVSAAWDGEKLYRWSRRWMEGEQAVRIDKTGRIASAEAHLQRMKELEALVKRIRKAGMLSLEDVSAQEFFRLEAERSLMLAKGK